MSNKYYPISLINSIHNSIHMMDHDMNHLYMKFIIKMIDVIGRITQAVLPFEITFLLAVFVSWQSIK